MNEQATQALSVANHRRTVMRDLRLRIEAQPFREGCTLVAMMLRDPGEDEAAIPVGRLLLAITRFGPQSLGHALRSAGIFSHDRRVRDLTFRQRDVLALALELRAARHHSVEDEQDQAAA